MAFGFGRRDFGVVVAGVITGAVVFAVFTVISGGGDVDEVPPPSDGLEPPQDNVTANISLGGAPAEPLEAYITAIYSEDYRRAYNQLAPQIQDGTPFSTWQQQIEDSEPENYTYTFNSVEEIIPTNNAWAEIRFSVQVSVGLNTTVITESAAVAKVSEDDWRLAESFSPYF